MSRDIIQKMAYQDFNKQDWNLFLLAEMGAMLHDLGKLSKHFIESKAFDSTIPDYHGQILFMDKELLNKLPKVKLFLFTPIYKLLGSDEIIRGIDLTISLSHFICSHHGCLRCLNPQKKSCLHKDQFDKHPLLQLLRVVDHMDASNPSNLGKQGTQKIFCDQFSIGEKELPFASFDNIRIQFYRSLSELLSESINLSNSIPDLYEKITKLCTKYFIHALSESRRWGNDITLLDHAKSVCAFYKAFLFQYFLTNKLPDSSFDLHFRILSISKEKCFSFASLIVQTKKDSYYLLPYFRKNSFLCKWIQKSLNLKPQDSIFLSGMDDWSILPEINKIRNLPIKKIEDIREDYRKDIALEDIKKVILYAELLEKDKIGRKSKSIQRHLQNLEKGFDANPEKQVAYAKKYLIYKQLQKKLSKGKTKSEIMQIYGWKTIRDGDSEIYNFFNQILSPIRPPSPIEMSKLFLKEYRKHKSYTWILKKYILNRPLVLGRIYAFYRVFPIIE